jgi:hypothetical protein
MRKIRDVLRLTHALGMSQQNRAIFARQVRRTPCGSTRCHAAPCAVDATENFGRQRCAKKSLFLPTHLYSRDARNGDDQEAPWLEFSGL